MRRLLLSAALASALAPAYGQNVSKKDVATISMWLKDLQFTNRSLPSFGGLRAHHTPSASDASGKQYWRVSPYINNIAVTSLLETSEPYRLDVAKGWIEWYFSHLNKASAPDGVPYEHFYLADGSGETTCIKPGDSHLCNYNDATDSAAATLFRLLHTFVRAGGDRETLLVVGRRQQIEASARVMLALQQPDGLLWAKSDYRAKYLEDNCEVYDGLTALADLERDLYHDASLSADFTTAAGRVRAGILAELYDTAANSWNIAKHEDGVIAHSDLSKWYPDMQCQMWPLLFTVVPPSSPRVASAMRALHTVWSGDKGKQRDWAAALATINNGFINADVAYGVLLGGDRSRATAYIDAARKLKWGMQDDRSRFSWPFTPLDAAWLLRILTHLDEQKRP